MNPHISQSGNVSVEKLFTDGMPESAAHLMIAFLPDLAVTPFLYQVIVAQPVRKTSTTNSPKKVETFLIKRSPGKRFF